MNKKEYVVHFSEKWPDMGGFWDNTDWRHIPPLEISFFRPEGSAHHPRVLCKLLYSPGALHGLFKVHDRYVRCVHSGFQAEVYRDSCVEFFVQPKPGKGYFNFEFNCGGAMLASYVTDPERVEGHVRGYIPLDQDLAGKMSIHHSLPDIVYPEIEDDTVWYLGFSIPFTLLEAHVGGIGHAANQVWRANFYKCGNDTSHPHWGAWSPLDERNFHAPANFGRLRFER